MGTMVAGVVGTLMSAALLCALAGLVYLAFAMLRLRHNGFYTFEDYISMAIRKIGGGGFILLMAALGILTVALIYYAVSFGLASAHLGGLHVKLPW